MSETDEMFEEEQRRLAEEEAIARKKMIKNTLEKSKPFKDFVFGKEKEWEELKKVLADHVFSILSLDNRELVSRDFLDGIKYVVTLVDSRITEFDSAFEQLGKE